MNIGVSNKINRVQLLFIDTSVGMYVRICQQVVMNTTSANACYSILLVVVTNKNT